MSRTNCWEYFKCGREPGGSKVDELGVCPAATEERGQLTIRTKAVQEWGVEVAISDTGCGIPEEHLEHIFDSFFSTKGEKVTGLGLAICKRIVVEHRAKIEMRSRVGDGTTMCVKLRAVVGEVPHGG